MKIQATTIIPNEDGNTRIEMQISDSAELDDSQDYVLISANVGDVGRSTRLQWLQNRALNQVVESISGIASELERELCANA